MTTQVCKSPLKRLKVAEVTSLNFVKAETCQWPQPTSILADWAAFFGGTRRRFEPGDCRLRLYLLLLFFCHFLVANSFHKIQHIQTTPTPKDQENSGNACYHSKFPKYSRFSGNFFPLILDDEIFKVHTNSTLHYSAILPPRNSIEILKYSASCQHSGYISTFQIPLKLFNIVIFLTWLYWL